MEINLYTVLNMFCAILLFLVLFHRLMSKERSKDAKLFNFVIIGAAIFLIADAIWGLVSSGIITVDRNISFLINFIYFTFLGLCALLWFLYSENQQNSILVRRWIFKVICWVPFGIYMVFVICSYFTNAIFYIDEDGNYLRGKFYFLQWIECYGYMGVTSIKALILAFKKENYSLKSKYITLGVFLIFPAISGPCQLIFTGSPMVSMGVALAIIQAHMNFQEHKISLDPLTQLNNRGEMVKYLSSRINDKKDTLVLYMLDLDGFKKVNDEHGHVEGDRILIMVAKVLKLYCLKHDLFVARYGGDEFIIISNVKESLPAEILEFDINNLLDDERLKNNISYPIHITVGSTKYNSNIKSIPELIDIADANLYENKHKTK